MTPDPRTLTASQTIERLHVALRDYIEAAYHVGHPTLVKQRARLLNEPGVIYQPPFLESTPRYTSDADHGRFEDLGLPAPALEALLAVSTASAEGGRLLYDPPFSHQAKALQHTLNEGKSLVVTTGTGSGKTESFLMPILGSLARQAAEGAPFKAHAVRAILLYPMNALVNDQLGRLRTLFGDPRLVRLFQAWAGRPARFARYTSRTLYPGVRTSKKDSERLKPIKTFYVDTLAAALDPNHDGHDQALKLYTELRARGKWPAKPDLIKWWGSGRWQGSDGNYRRGVTLPDDAELLTRHEVLAAPPDILVTNYSMLEYMMMRPVERDIFIETAKWLADNPAEKLILVIDEAHLYRGASGAEVALLLRRLQERLGVGPDRLQVIATSASFEEEDKARAFASDLTGLAPDRFEVVRGDLDYRVHTDAGTSADADLLAGLDLHSFYGEDAASRLSSLGSFFAARGVAPQGDEPVERTLYRALETYGPLGRLVNASMKTAQPLGALGAMLFQDSPTDVAEKAATVLMALGSAAKPEAGAAGLLPCRIHAFFRGLPGLWACLDPQCSALEPDERGGPTGALYAQPREACTCHARVFELYTCRSCGTAFARAYTDNVVRPKNLWSEPGAAFTLDGQRVESLEPIDLLLEPPPPAPLGGEPATVERHELDLDTGLLDDRHAARTRTVYLPPSASRDRTPAEALAAPHVSGGQFVPCPICDDSGRNGRSTVMDHQTKGDQPFQALITAQVEVQPPSPNATADPAFAPLRGRKVLIFSDSRQLAARLSPTVQSLSTRDALRPLISAGYHLLYRHDRVREDATLDDLYTAVLLASADLGVRLRPERTKDESFHGPDIAAAVADKILDDPKALAKLLSKQRAKIPPQSLAKDLLDALSHRYYGLTALGLGSVRESDEHAGVAESLPSLDGLAETTEQKQALVRLWLQHWLPGGYLNLSCLDAGAIGREVRTHKGTFKSLDRWLGSAAKAFKTDWLPTLLSTFAEARGGGTYWLLGSELALDLDGPWAYCDRCRATQRPFPDSSRCVQCVKDTVRVIADLDADPVFAARKGYYRASTAEALADTPRPPMSLIAAEHTAQLNAAQEGEVFSDAEIHELLFQDVDLGPDPETQHRRYAVDVLSCTTTMEVGIDIGALSGVALRSLPPARSNYQQRAGRAGRRGDAVATVVAFGSADSHDEHYFSKPAEMISGPVTDPELTLSNRDITRRHLTAYLLQRYFHDEFPDVTAEERPSLFSALGTVAEFKGTEGLCRPAFEMWLRLRDADLCTAVDGWLPSALSAPDRAGLLDGIVTETLRTLDEALDIESGDIDAPDAKDPTAPEADAPEEAPAVALDDAGAAPVDREESTADAADGKDTLLDRLLYQGVLPRYAFPTDVAAFNVFDVGRSTPFRPAFRYQPQQGLAGALSQYAPGKQPYIGNRRWTSGALYSQNRSDLFDAWEKKRVYFECEACGFAEARDPSQGGRGEVLTCPACKREDAFGKGRHWIIPPGFAHPVDLAADTTPDAPFSQSYATRAKLAAAVRQDRSASTGDGASTSVEPVVVNSRVTSWAVRSHLLVTNRGPREEGYSLCTRCGRIERSAQGTSTLSGPHNKPYPDREPMCPGDRLAPGIVLGTEFISDILLLAFRLDRTSGVVLRPGELGTQVALRTVSEAIAQAACEVLQIEPSELAAEYRTALTPGGADGDEVEVYLYDTLPGGAGFSHLAGQRMEEVLTVALARLDGCPEGCDASCYRCLRSFGNRFEHDRLDRHVGADLLRFLLTDEPPTLSDTRQARTAHRLHSALKRALKDRATVDLDVAVDLPGLDPVQAPILVRSPGGTETIVAVTSPVAPDVPPTPALATAREALRPVLLVDEMLVRKNLPRAVERVLSLLAL